MVHASLFVGGCSSPNEAPVDCALGATHQPLVGGTSQEIYWEFSSDDLRAIVRIESSDPSSKAICTGTVVAPGWVLTAEHCLEIPSMQVRISPGSSGQSETLVGVTHSIAHPELDLALIQVTTEADLEKVVPFALASDTVTESSIGERVELAGFGVDARGQWARSSLR